ncbi:MAG: enoyl-CoA hydratase/isomerase family protein [Legionellaceae bacterium]|nr:enoyl-CoA hydratase/isomerase family protein [Legionellaceae bacterium]
MNMDLIFTQERHIGLVSLNRPQALNALSLSMIRALQQQLTLWQNDHTIHAVVIRAVEGKAFCAGGDVRWLYETGRAHDPEQMPFFWHEYRLNQYIHDYPKPYVAMMDGLTMGGGVGISMHGSHPVASERFIFAMPETSIGFFPDIGASHLLTRCPDHVGMYLGLTGNRVNAQDAYDLGLVKHVIRSDAFSDALHALIDANLSSDAAAGVTTCLQSFAAPVLSSSLSEEQRGFIAHCFKKPDVESILAALNEENGEWHRDILTNLNYKSPLSLKVTLKQLQQAEHLTLADCLRVDSCLVQHFMRDHDFYEGVRALLVDKDKTPHWEPEGLANVNEGMVSRYFEC